MANRDIDYSIQLNHINDPAQSRAGDLMARAGSIQAAGIENAARTEAHVQEQVGKATGDAAALRGKAKAIGIEQDTKTISFLGTTAIDATKGYLDAGLSKEIKASLDKLEGYGPEALKAQANVDRLRSDDFAKGVAEQLTVLQEQSGGMEGDSEQLTAQLRQDITRYADAQSQGVLSRGEVLTRVAAAVKKYSAMMPGWASEFRKVGADLTGIDRLDVYGVHKALTTESNAEKMRDRMAAAQLELDKQIAGEMGVPITAITPAIRLFNTQSKQLKVGAENAKRRIEMNNLGQEEADKQWGRIIQMEVSASIADLGQEFASLGALHSDPNKALEANEMGLKLAGKLAMMQTSIERSIMGMTQPAPGKTALSVKEAEARIAALRPMFSNYQEGVKNIEGRNMLAAMVKNSEGNLNLFMTQWQLANPHIAVLNKVGVTSEIVKAFVSLGSEEEFKKRFGGALTEAMKGVMRTPDLHANLFQQVVSGQPVNLRTVAQTSPALSTTVMKDLVESVQEWSKDPAPTDQKKVAFSNAMGTYNKHFNVQSQRDMEEAYKQLSSPDVQKFLGTLTPMQRANAVAPLMANIDSGMKGAMAEIHNSINAFNNPEANAFARAGIRLSFGKNPLTGLLEVQEDTSNVKQGSFFTDTPGGAAGFGPGMAGRFSQNKAMVGNFNSNTDSSEFKQRAVQLTEQLNRVVDVFTLGHQILSPESGRTVTELRDFVVSEMGRIAPAAPTAAAQPPAPPLRRGEVSGRIGGVSSPDNTVGLDEPRVLAALRHAEGSHVNAGLSPKGALGPYQLMEETAKAFGLKVDKAAGIDERTDERKSAVAATKFMVQLHKAFDGDMLKMAAGYNLGEPKLKAAIEKATKLGAPEAWISYVPTETVKYIGKYLEKYGPVKSANAADGS